MNYSHPMRYISGDPAGFAAKLHEEVVQDSAENNFVLLKWFRGYLWLDYLAALGLDCSLPEVLRSI